MKLLYCSFTYCSFIAATMVALACLPGSAAEPSAWSSAHGAAIRLIPGDRAADGAWRAGIKIRLEPGWKTYWRSPGNSGVAPTFDWSASDNLADVSVLWPAPELFSDGLGQSIGYKSDVVLPLRVVPKDPAKPVALSLAMQYGACKDVCVPATGEALVTLDDKISPDSVALIDGAERAVPLHEPLGGPGPLSIIAVKTKLQETPPRLVIEARADPEAILLAEGAADWYLPQPKPEPSSKEGHRRFVLALEGLPEGARLPGAELRFTLMGTAGAVETPYTLP